MKAGDDWNDEVYGHPPAELAVARAGFNEGGRAVVSSNKSKSDSSADSPSPSSMSTSDAEVVDGERERPMAV